MSDYRKAWLISMKLRIKDIQDEQVTIEWDKVEGVQDVYKRQV